MGISVVILTKNEEGNIIDCLDSLKFAEEIVIIDDYSTDRTEAIVNSLKDDRIKFFQRHLNSNFSAQRNFGLEKAKNEWILFVDADERVSKDLSLEILRSVNDINSRANGYSIKRTDTIWNKKMLHGEAGNIKIVRLGKKNSGEWKGRVHEEWKIQGKVGTLKSPSLHFPHQSVGDFLSEINFYTSLRAEELYGKKIPTNALSIMSFPFGKFVLNYFVKKGYRDGIEGLLMALLMSFHSFLVRGKLYLLWKRNGKR